MDRVVACCKFTFLSDSQKMNAYYNLQRTLRILRIYPKPESKLQVADLGMLWLQSAHCRLFEVLWMMNASGPESVTV